MRIIGVIDLLGGRAVHARGGHRGAYQPVETVAGIAVNGEPLALARRYRELGIADLYVADLDAIGNERRQDTLLQRLAALADALWVDAGVSSAAVARECLGLGASRVVVGLETLRAWDDLTAIAAEIGRTATVFSLDLRGGRPLAMVDHTPAALARRASAAGAGAIIVLDVARVGMRAGIDVALLGRIREAAPGVPLVAGGGVRDDDDLDRLAAAGCDAALVATAIHAGTLHRHSVNR